ncbi:MAG: hypothetical protein JWQ71_1488 [Pedosphaera sp.]|nr:hypothetical protein [Pedosphaera sp.]
MSSEATQSADYFKLVDWLHANKKPLQAIVIALLLIGVAVTGFVVYKNQKEASANEALSNLKVPTGAPGTATATADDYLKVANEHSGTKAGSRALLVAAGILFDTGKFADAETQFKRFLQENSDSPLASQALLGVAASLEAQGKKPEATAKYKEIVDNRPSDPVIFQAKSALARLYVAQNKPDLALKQYEDLAKGNNQDSWSAEAPIQAEELVAKYPNLKAPAPAPVPTVPMTLSTKPVISNAPAVSISTGSISAKPSEPVKPAKP